MHIDWAARGSWASFCASIIVGAFIYGRLTQQVKNNSEAIAEVKADVRELAS